MSISGPDPDICPICHQANGCEHHCGGPDGNTCWCHRLSIPKEVFRLVPTEAINKACICRQCLIKNGAIAI